MSSVTASMPKVFRPSGKVNGNGAQSPASIAIRLGAFLLALVVVSAWGPSLLVRAFNGPSDSYTVVLKNGVPISQAVAKLKADGYNIASVDETGAGTAVVADVSSRHADDILKNEDVAFVQANNEMQAHHSLVESVKLKFTLND